MPVGGVKQRAAVFDLVDMIGIEGAELRAALLALEASALENVHTPSAMLGRLVVREWGSLLHAGGCEAGGSQAGIEHFHGAELFHLQSASIYANFGLATHAEGSRK